jgi:hypothetical protein
MSARGKEADGKGRTETEGMQVPASSQQPSVHEVKLGFASAQRACCVLSPCSASLSRFRRYSGSSLGMVTAVQRCIGMARQRAWCNTQLARAQGCGKAAAKQIGH